MHAKWAAVSAVELNTPVELALSTDVEDLASVAPQLLSACPRKLFEVGRPLRRAVTTCLCNGRR